MAIVDEFKVLRSACDAISRHLLWPHKPPAIPEPEPPPLVPPTPVQSVQRPRCKVCANQCIPVGGSWYCQSCNFYVVP